MPAARRASIVWVALGLALVVLAPLGGCRRERVEGENGATSTEPGGATTGDLTTGTEPTSLGETAPALTAKVKARLATDSRVSALAIDVDTQNGIVTLKGNVDVEQAKSAAEEIARGTEGVSDVVNMITVGPGGPSGTQP